MAKRFFFIAIILLLNASSLSSQEISWRCYSFGDVCCHDAAWITDIFTFSNGDVFLKVNNATAPPSFLSSTDNGKSWNGLLSNYFTDKYIITITDYESGKILTSAIDYGSNRASIHLANSLIDSAKFWKKLSNGIPPEARVHAFAVNSNYDVYAVTDYRKINSYDTTKPSSFFIFRRVILYGYKEMKDFLTLLK